MEPNKQYIITEDLKQRLLDNVDIVALIAADIKLSKQSSKNMSACCPFHSENTPSFTVSSQKNFYHCFGCGAHGNAISWVMNFKNMEFVEAIVHLGKIANIEIPTVTYDEKKNFKELVSFNRWFLNALRRETTKDMSALLPLLQGILAVKPTKDGEDESFVSDLVTVKSIDLRKADEYKSIQDNQEVAALVKKFDSVQPSFGHFVRDKRGYVCGISLRDKSSVHGYQYMSLPLGKRLNESVLGLEQAGKTITDEEDRRSNVFVFNNPEEYFVNRAVLSGSYAMCNPAGSPFFSKEQMAEIVNFSRRRFVNSIFKGGIFMQVPERKEDLSSLMPALRALHADSELLCKSGVFFDVSMFPKSLKNITTDTDNVESTFAACKLTDFVTYLAKTELNIGHDAVMSVEEKYAVLTKVIDLIDLNPGAAGYENVVNSYALSINLPTDIYLASKQVTASPIVKDLFGNYIQDLCFAMMCNRPSQAVTLHTEIESYMDARLRADGLAAIETQDKKIFSDLDIGSKVGEIFMTSSVCCSVMEQPLNGVNSIVAIAKQLEREISREFAARFIQLGTDHRSVVLQLPKHYTPLKLISQANALVDNFVHRMNSQEEYKRFLILNGMNDSQLPMSSFAALTLDIFAELDTELLPELKQN